MLKASVKVTGGKISNSSSDPFVLDLGGIHVYEKRRRARQDAMCFAVSLALLVSGSSSH